ncbi:Aste57867_10725 [Aphanomyces stellatus]|uniref:Aste57867_10725 protein n=1 Tax=Aphanomyces stellatus TaxID=120398 RepID=A0A485KR74_9STRA|nr:hypothetical protein As57867_010685 [Aphanomyces stellatus]VFT87595.1 Aste57867_10725 [Aphanomyces stellatus]
MPRRHHSSSDGSVLPQPPLVEIVFLGTASMVSSSTRHVSGIGVAIGGDCWIFDAGEGTNTQLAKSNVLQSAVSRIFVTHMHGDHVFGLMGLLLSVGCTGDMRDIQVVGPPGLRRYLRRNLAETQSSMKCRYHVDELWFHEPSKAENTNEGLYSPFEDAGFNVLPREDGTWAVPPRTVDMPDEICRVFAGPLKHTLEPCYGFVVQERDYPGRIELSDVVKARLMSDENKAFLLGRGIANPLTLLSQLQHGTPSVDLVDGVLTSADVMTESKSGRRITILGDTCDSRAVAKLAVGSDVLVHECTNAYIDSMDAGHTTREEVEAATYCHGHSTPHGAGRFAHAVQCDQLVLTHFSRRYKDDCSMEPVMERIKHQVREHFTTGTIECAHDLELILVPMPKAVKYNDAQKAFEIASAAADASKAVAIAYYKAHGAVLAALPERSRRLLGLD